MIPKAKDANEFIRHVIQLLVGLKMASRRFNYKKISAMMDMENSSTNFDKNDLEHFKHCLALAEKALDAGDEPFGSILVNDENKVIAEARNRVNEISVLAHPEIELARWAIEHLSAAERKGTMMYTTGEHCPMCAAAHGWTGLGTVAYLSSGKQLSRWLEEMGEPAAPINFIPIQEIVPNCKVKGPADGPLVEKIKSFHKKYRG